MTLKQLRKFILLFVGLWLLGFSLLLFSVGWARLDDGMFIHGITSALTGIGFIAVLSKP